MTKDTRFGDGDKIPKKNFSRRFRRRNDRQTGLAWLDDPYNHTRGEMALWVAVITQAMQDALSKSKNPDALYHKHEAVNWLTGSGKDFILVCLCADFDPSYIRRMAKRALSAPRPWRAEAGKGKRYLERKAYRRRIKTLSTGGSPAETKIVTGPWTTK